MHCARIVIIKLIFLFPLLALGSETITKRPLCSVDNEVYLNIFVHGIINIKPHLSLSNLIRFMRDQITNSVYAYAVEIMRKDPFFYQFYAMEDLGLHKIDTDHLQEGYASGAFALSFDAFSTLNAPNPHQENFFYTFGWSGLLSTQVRYQEAFLFYEQLEKEVAEYKKRGIIPKIRIIAYSHGGYIALNLGAVFDTLKPLTPAWLVDELVLIGVPVISDTDFLINSALFKRVYHFYSPGDRVQVVDCLATNRFFSNRVFSSRCGFFLPDKLIQVQLRFKRIARTCFARDGCKHHKEHYPTRLLRNADPGHTELWSFGWTSGYRTYLPYYPFPAGAYIGYIINALNSYGPFGNHPTVDIRPFQNAMIITSNKPRKEICVPFPTSLEHNHIVTLIQPCVPKNYSKQIYEQKAQEALAIAHDKKKAEKLKRRRMRFNRGHK
jgi:hypothetical protein